MDDQQDQVVIRSSHANVYLLFKALKNNSCDDTILTLKSISILA